MSWLENLKVGDQVAWKYEDHEGLHYSVGKVSKITKTQIVVSEPKDKTGFGRWIRFRRSDCRELGPDGRFYKWLIPCTPNVLREAADQKEREQLFARLEWTPHDVSTDQLRRIVAILGERKDG